MSEATEGTGVEMCTGAEGGCFQNGNNKNILELGPFVRGGAHLLGLARGRGKSIKEDIMEGTDNHRQFVKEKGKAP